MTCSLLPTTSPPAVDDGLALWSTHVVGDSTVYIAPGGIVDGGGNGVIRIFAVNSIGPKYVQSDVIYNTNTRMLTTGSQGGGSGDVVDAIRLITGNGSRTFSAGSVSLFGIRK